MWLRQLVCICVWSVIYWLLFLCRGHILIIYFIYNIFVRAAGGRALTYPEIWHEGGIIMSTYEEFMVLLTTASLIIAILNFAHKK